MQQGIVFMPFLLPLLPLICAPEIIHAEIAQRRSQRVDPYDRLDWIGVLPQTEMTPAGELYLDSLSTSLVNEHRIRARLVVDLDEATVRKEWSIEIDTEADCAAGTLRAESARTYKDTAATGELVAVSPGAKEASLQDTHPLFDAALVKICPTLPARYTASAADQTDPMPDLAADSSALAARLGLPAPGTRWRYRFSDRQFGRFSTEYAVQIERYAGSFHEVVSSSGMESTQRPLRWREAEILSRPLRANATLVELSPYYSPEGNDIFTSAGSVPGYPEGSLGPWVVKVAGRRWEQVTVPAGSYRALRIDLSGVRERRGFAYGQVGEFELSAWYAPDVKRVARMEHRTWAATSASGRGPQNSHDVVELLAYEPPSVGATANRR